VRAGLCGVVVGSGGLSATVWGAGQVVDRVAGTAPEEHSVREAPSNEDTGNRVSVNGARTLVQATGAGSNFGNGGRFADKTGSKGTVTG
jgi:hypothetical protein